ncbi:MAG TPA: xanthine dehydrogenase family protein molybdopterin-binding subunit [Candidatus Angelobacter sp.]
MADETNKYSWPAAGERSWIGKRISRVDGPAKVTGAAKYTYDTHRPGMLYGRVVRCPHAHAKIVSIDTSAAEKMPGVVAVHVVQGPGSEIHWAGDDLVVVAAVDENAAGDAARAVKIEYEVLPHFVDDFHQPQNVAEDTSPLSRNDLVTLLINQMPAPQIIERIQKRGVSFKADQGMIDQLKQNNVPESVISALQAAPVKEAPAQASSHYRKEAELTTGDPDAAFKESEVVSEGEYGCPVITHCCMESHGSIAEWPAEDQLFVHLSTQNVSGVSGEYAQALKIKAADVHVHQDHIGGGFGSKFGADRWGIYTAQVSKKAGKPVRVMLERAPELEVAGARPSAFAKVKVGAKKDGTLLAWQSESWGTGGPGGGGAPPMPYVVRIPNQRRQHTAALTNIGPARAWRAPNHPQGCLITMSALDDMAAKLNMDPVDLLLKNIALTAPPEDKTGRANTYHDELLIGSDLMGWKKKWHPRGQGGSGPVKSGLGVAIHTWGGRGHQSTCSVAIRPDGSVEMKMGTQDLGTGTRTAILMIAADTLGLTIEQINLKIGDNQYPPSGGSGGSTTIGGVSSSTRRAAVDARDQLLAKVADALKAKPEELEAVKGTIRVKSAPTRSMSWKDACARLGTQPIEVTDKNLVPNEPLISSGVGGAVMADVSVDVETGIVKMNKMVCVQDCGLVINLKTAESQVYGAMIMGIATTLYEEKVMDPTTGTMLNPNMDFYRLAGYSDIGELVVHMMTGKGYDERGPIGLGEPPTVGPMAAIANAVANAIGMRVPFMPITPDRVVAALSSNQGGSHAGI